MAEEKAKVTPEIISVITAALAVMLDTSASDICIKNVTPNGRISWGQAGILDLMSARQGFSISWK